MGRKSDVPVTKPVRFWEQPLKANFKDLFKATSKLAINLAACNMDKAAADAVDMVSSIGLGKEPGQLAWALIHRSLAQALRDLVKESQTLFTVDLQEIDFDALMGKLDLSFEAVSFTINRNFFARPRDIPVVESIQYPFRQWLRGVGVPEAQAQSISSRLPAYFVFALHDEWRCNLKDYAPLEEALDDSSPFSKEVKRERGYLTYASWLQKQIDEPMFDEAFGLRQVYIPLRAYYEEKISTSDDVQRLDRISERSVRGEQEIRRHVVDLDNALNKWLTKGDPKDPIRIISGGPGCGKSSFAKIFAAQVAEKGSLALLGWRPDAACSRA